MTRVVQFRRGTSAQNDLLTGASGEITVDTTNKTLRVHDGSTVGGTPLATQAGLNSVSANASQARTDAATALGLVSASANAANAAMVEAHAASNTAIAAFEKANTAVAAAGANGYVQFYTNGALEGNNRLVFNSANGSLAVGGATVTSSAPVLDLSQTWSNSSVTFTASKINVTDTASTAASLLADFQVGGTSRVKIDKTGFLTVNSSTSGVKFATEYMAILTDTGRPSVVFSRSATTDIFAAVGISNTASPGLTLSGTFDLSWAPTQYLSSGTSPTKDLALSRDAADTLAQRRATNAQTFRVYNTYTDASNYERGKIAWSSNVLQIGTEKLGTGVGRGLELQTDGVQRLRITSAATNQVYLSNDAFLFETVAGNGIITSASLNVRLGVVQVNEVGSIVNPQFNIGGSTSSYPAIRRNGTTAQIRLADNSGDADLSAKTITADAQVLSANGVINDANTNRTLSAGDNGKVLYFTSSSAITLNCAGSLPAGFSVTVVQGGTGTVTVAANSQTLVSRGSVYGTAGQYAMATIVSPVAGTFILGATSHDPGSDGRTSQAARGLSLHPGQPVRGWRKGRLVRPVRHVEHVAGQRRNDGCHRRRAARWQNPRQVRQRFSRHAVHGCVPACAVCAGEFADEDGGFLGRGVGEGRNGFRQCYDRTGRDVDG